MRLMCLPGHCIIAEGFLGIKVSGKHPALVGMGCWLERGSSQLCPPPSQELWGFAYARGWLLS